MQALRYRDVTIKARLTEPLNVERILKNLNAQFIGIDFQKDTYFHVSKGKLKLRTGTIENLITHYERISDGQAERTIVYHYDLNPTGSEIEALFKKYQPLKTIEKKRKIYLIANLKIHIDTLPDQSNFLEIEARDRTDSIDLEQLKNQCLSLIKTLEIAEDELLPTGYLETSG
jgi:predicted adenylyl cyclase CyaB